MNGFQFQPHNIGPFNSDHLPLGVAEPSHAWEVRRTEIKKSDDVITRSASGLPSSVFAHNSFGTENTLIIFGGSWLKVN